MGQDGSAALTDYLQLLWRRRLPIIGGTLFCGLAALVTSVLAARVYEARVTLIVQPPLIPGELNPTPLSVEAYRVLLESDYIIDQSRIAMLGRMIIAPDAPIEAVKRMLWVGTYKETKETPLLDLWARAGSGQKASSAANTWAEVFLRENSKLTKQRQEASARTIETQYPTLQRTVAEAEAKLKSGQDQFEGTLLELDRAWKRRLTEVAKETDALRHEHEQETARLRLEYESRWNPEFLRRRLSAQEASLLGLENELLDAQVRIKIQQDTVAKIKEELQSEPVFLVLAKAITDEALWDRIESSGSTSQKGLDQLVLRSEVLNPVHQDLSARLAAAQVEYDSLDRKLAHSPGEIERLRRETDALRDLAGAKTNELLALLARRELGLNNLQADRDVELRTLKATGEEEVGRLRRNRDYEVEALTREAQAARAAYSSLAAQHQSAQLAKLADESQVRIGALAIAPQRPTRPRTFLNVVTALVIGLILSLLLAFFIEHVQPTLAAQAGRPAAQGIRSGGIPSGSGRSARATDG